MQAVIGLEVHLALSTKTKLFCACPTGSLLPPNSSTCPVCLGLPGSLPTINREALEKALTFSLALHCQAPLLTQFQRKNYFYPDAPKNYQLSQYEKPLGEHGYLELTRRIGIKRCHLEEDAGKLMHPAYAEYSLMDLNRAGAPLVEMVTEPELRTPEEARDFLQRVRAIAQALGVSEANPEEGKMRAAVNISVHEPGEPLGEKVEIKNLNSFKSVQRALEFEIKRQGRLLEEGGSVSQETRGWDDGGQKTYLLRSKEEEADYRYFPEPDLPPMTLSRSYLEALQARTPELPEAKEQRYLAAGVRVYDAVILAYDVALASFFDRTLDTYKGQAQAVANWLNGDVSGWLNARGLSVAASSLTPENLASLVTLVDAGAISGKTAKDILPEVMEGESPARLVEQRGLKQITDTGAISSLVNEVIAKNPGMLEQIRANPKAVNALLGQVMRASQGKAKPELVRALLHTKLGLEQEA